MPATTTLTPSIVLDKTADRTSVDAVGQVINYSFVATNTGRVSVAGGGLVDILPVRDLYCPPNVNLDPGDHVTCTANYTVTQADLDAGSIVNLASATAVDGRGRVTAPSSDSWVVGVAQRPALSLSSETTPLLATSVGERIRYTVRLTNDGNVTLDAVTLLGQRPDLVISGCAPRPLAPGESRECQLSLITTQADIDAGEVVAGVAASALLPGSATPLPDAPSADLTIPATQRPAISLSKNADVSFIEHPGDPISYHLVLRNTGNFTLTQVTLTDDLVDMTGLSCAQPMTLAPGEVRQCTVTHLVGQTEFDSGMVTSITEVTASSPAGERVSATARLDTPVVQDPVLSITKRADRDHLVAPGELLNYLFAITNIGDTTLTNLDVHDPMPGLTSVVCDRYALAPGESAYCQAGYPVTQADIDAGDLVNTVTVTGVSPDGSLSQQGFATSIVPVLQRPELRLIKNASTTRVTAPGQVIRYAFLALNTGNVTASEVRIVDDMPGLSDMTCGTQAPVTLAPGQVLVCEANYTVTAADLAAGEIVNTAQVEGRDPFGQAITSASVQQSVQATAEQLLQIRKTADVMTVDAVGDPINYTLVISNLGTEQVDQLELVDPMPGLSELVCEGGPLSSLAPGQIVACQASYQVTAEDMDLGLISNVAVLRGITASGDTVVERSGDSIVAAVPHQEISLTKQSSPQLVIDPDATITYTFTLTNNSTQTVHDPTIRDDMPGLYGWDCPDAGLPLAPGASRVCTALFDINQTIFESGQVFNLATAYAFSRYGAPLATSAYNLLVFLPRPELTLTKTADRSSVSAAGEPIEYTLAVTNTGNETVNAIRVSDPMLTELSCDAALVSLAPGQSASCTGVGAATQAQLDAGTVPNTAQVVGEAASGDPRNPADDVRAQASHTLSATAQPGASLLVRPDRTSAGSGELVRFFLEVTNTGNLTLTGFDWSFTTPVGQVLCPDEALPLAPGQTAVCWVDYVVTPQDAAAGSAWLSAEVAGSTARDGVGFGPVAASGVVTVQQPPDPQEPGSPSPSVPGESDPASSQPPSTSPATPPSTTTRTPRPPVQLGVDKPVKLPRTGGADVGRGLSETPGSLLTTSGGPLEVRRSEEEN